MRFLYIPDLFLTASRYFQHENFKKIKNIMVEIDHIRNELNGRSDSAEELADEAEEFI